MVCVKVRIPGDIHVVNEHATFAWSVERHNNPPEARQTYTTEKGDIKQIEWTNKRKN